MNIRHLVLVLLLALTVSASTPVFCQCVVSNMANGTNVNYDVIRLQTHGIPSGLTGTFSNAFGAWNNYTCNGINNNNFPAFSESTGGFVVNVYYNTGFNPANDQSCGRTTSGSRFDLYQYSRTDTGATRVCTASAVFEDTVAHELGHVLGLNHPQGASCSNYIMANTGYTASGTYIQRSIQASECMKVAETNVTPNEQMEDQCEQDPDNCPRCDPQEVNCGSPIVIDFDDRGLTFTSLSQGVQFDIDNDGFLEQTPWLRARGHDAFLVYDRDDNGVIDNGSELFGDVTPFVSGFLAENGYQALADLDINRGNGNGFMDAGDEVFPFLGIWRDRNHNARTDAGELESLEEAGVVALATSFYVSLRSDENGNELRFVSYALVESFATGEIIEVETVDVVFPFEELNWGTSAEYLKFLE